MITMRKLLTIILLLSTALVQAQDVSWLQRSLTGYTGYSWGGQQKDTILWGAEIRALASSGDMSPYHLWANRENTSPRPYSASVSAGIRKIYTNPERWIDYSFNLQPAMNYTRDGAQVWFREGFAAARLYVFELTAGMRYSDNYGYYQSDLELSSGGLLFTRNAMAIPRLTFATNGYVPFPFLFGYLEVKGGLSHGWMGSNRYVEKTLMHHKYVGFRLGGSMPVNVSYEFHHAAQWGGVSPDYGVLGTSLRDFINTFFARSGGVMDNDKFNAQGNHLCSQVLALDFKLDSWKASAYWQTISEDGPIEAPWDALNRRDGFWGLSLTNPDFPFVSGLTYEYLKTSNQAGAFHDRDGVIYGGGDGYYGNSVYRSGWTYNGHAIGHPLIIMPILDDNTRPRGLRLRTHHAGIKGDIYGYKYRALVSYSRLYDTYEYITDVYNHAFLFELSRNFPRLWGLDFKISAALDKGSQFGNSLGFMFTVSKTGVLWNK